ncbi:hypothetical protein P8605_12500 [Streptomyces sp. T-3]|nr:hypothetical protein [Streptomyces sp. T-3]
MADKMSVSPAELHTAGSAQYAVGQDLKGPIEKTVADAGSAAESLKGWAVGAELQEIADTWELGLTGLYNRIDTGSFNLHETAKTHNWNDELVKGDFEAFDGTGVGGIASAPATGGIGVMSAPAGGSATGGPISRDATRPGLDDFQDAGTVMPTYDPSVHNVAPAPGTPPLSPDDMRNARPVMPTVDEDAVHAGSGPEAHNVAPAPGTPPLSTDDMLNARPVTPGVGVDEIRGGPAPHEGPSLDRFNDFG